MVKASGRSFVAQCGPLIPQTVDDGVAEGRHHRVDDGQHLVEVHGLDATGAAVDEESC